MTTLSPSVDCILIKLNTWLTWSQPLASQIHTTSVNPISVTGNIKIRTALEVYFFNHCTCSIWKFQGWSCGLPLVAMSDPSPTERGQGLNPHLHRDNVGRLNPWATMGTLGSIFLGAFSWTCKYLLFPWIPPSLLWVVTYGTDTLMLRLPFLVQTHGTLFPSLGLQFARS